MGDCQACNTGRRARDERRYSNEPRQVRRSSLNDPSQFFHSKQRRTLTNGYTPFSEPKQDTCYSCNPQTCLYVPPCPEANCCCPEQTESGFLHSIRNGFQKIFNGNGKRGFKGKGFNYSLSHLKSMECLLEKLEDDAGCIDSSIKDAFDYEYPLNCSDLRYSLGTIQESLEKMRCDLMCAYDLYSSCRDSLEFNLTCTLLDGVNSLEECVNDLSLQLDCMEYQTNPYPRDYNQEGFRNGCEVNCKNQTCVKQPACKPNCRKPCCYQPTPAPIKIPNNDYPRSYRRPPVDFVRPVENVYRNSCYVKPNGGEVGYHKPYYPKPMACSRPKRRTNGVSHNKQGLCRTSSVIPVGVMLVKL